MAHDPLTKDDLRHDAIQDWMFHTVDYIYKRRLWFGTGAGVLLAVAIAVFAYVAVLRHAAQEAAAAFNAAEAVYLDQSLAPEERLSAAANAFEQFVQGHGKSDLVPYAWMYLAAVAREREQPAAAISAYEQVFAAKSVAPALRALAQAGLANLRESQGDLAAANEVYRQIGDERYADLAALGLARVALAEEDADAARGHLERLSQDFPDSPLAQFAQQALFFMK